MLKESKAFRRGLCVETVLLSPGSKIPPATFCQ
jgi:hypothetical protein